MIKLKNLITERRSQEISKEDAINAVRTSCTDYLRLHNVLAPIYRGITTGVSYSYVEPSKHERRSANTSNEYTMLLDVLPSWKEYPKRSRSIVCATREYTADGYGVVHVVIPFNGAKIAVCPYVDFWISFKKVNDTLGVGDLNQFNIVLKYIYQEVFDGETLSSDKETFLQQLKNFDNKEVVYPAIDSMHTSSDRYRDYKHIAQVLTKNGDIMSTLDDLFDPDDNDIKLYDYRNFRPEVLSNKGGHEIWTDANCLLIDNRETYPEFMAGLTNQ